MQENTTRALFADTSGDIRRPNVIITCTAMCDHVSASKRTCHNYICRINMTPPIEPHGLIISRFMKILDRELENMLEKLPFRTIITTNTRKT